MSLEWTGPAASKGKGNDPVPCTEDQRPASEPSLAAMTDKAISLLEGRNGFFLQVEGAESEGLPTGLSTNVSTKDGQTLSLTYGTVQSGSQQHTGAVVPVWGKGPGSLDVLGTNDHTDLFDALGG
jgi:alkaline phosphatase